MHQQSSFIHRVLSAWKSGRSVLHVFALASYPLLAIYVHNANQVEFHSILRSWILSVTLCALLLAALSWSMRSLENASIAASMAVIAFWSYGHLYDALKAIGLSGSSIVRHRYLIPLLIGLLAIAIWRVRQFKAPERTIAMLNAAGLIALSLPLAQLAYRHSAAISRQPHIEGREEGCSLIKDPSGPLPDIYFIVMDAYERDDVLRNLHDYDNGPFLGALESRGFYIARGSLSNYRHTELSLASTLNLDYIQSFAESYSPKSSNRDGLFAMIRDSRVRRELECIGYHVVSLETGVPWTEWKDADYFFAREGGVLHDMHLLGGVTRLEAMLLRTTALRAALDLTVQMQGLNRSTTLDPLDDHRQRILFVLDQLRSIPHLPSPKLVYAHILSPHPPMVFGRNGEAVYQASFETDAPSAGGERTLVQAYADQVHYLNGRLLEVVDAVLATSAIDPIIIIEGDHGWAESKAEDKLAILNAYRLPQGGNAGLYPTITPVNTFRYIFNTSFGARLEMLPDASYFSDKESVFKFIEIENTWSTER